MTEKELKELRESVIQLGKLVQRHGKKYYFAQLKQLSKMLECIDSDLDNIEKTEYLVYCYQILFPAKGGLTEFYIHDDDFETRKKLNAPLDEAVAKMKEIIKPYLEP